jgi:hypothetical protein
MSNKIHIDELFREGLSNGEEAMVPSAWSNMAKMLDGDNPYEKEETKKRPFLWILGMGLLLISAIAAGTKFLFPGGQMQQNAASLVAPAPASQTNINDSKPLAVANASSIESSNADAMQTSNDDANNLSVASDMPNANSDNTNNKLDLKNENAEPENKVTTTAKQSNILAPVAISNEHKVIAPLIKAKAANVTKQNVNSDYSNATVTASATDTKGPNIVSDAALAPAKNKVNKVNVKQNIIDNAPEAEATTAVNTAQNFTSITSLPILSAQQFLLSLSNNKNALLAATIARKNNLVMLPEATDVKDTFGYVVAINNSKSSVSTSSSQASNGSTNKLATSKNDKSSSADAELTKGKKRSKKERGATKADASQSADNAAIAKTTDAKNSSNNTSVDASSNNKTATPDNASQTTKQNSNNQLLANRKKEAPKKSTTPNAKEQMSDKLMNTIDKIKSRGFIDLGTGKIKVDPALFTGINSQFLNNKNDLGGFHMGMNCIIQIRRNLELMPHALFNYRTNGGYTIRDTVQTISDRSGPRFNGTDNEFAYTAATTAMTYNFKRTMSIEAPIALQWRPVRRVGIFAGVNLAYGFKYKTSNFYKTTTTTEIDIVPTTQNYVFPTDRISTYKDIDFKGRFGAGYLFGANWQATPNFFVDARVTQNIWDNSTTPSSKIISSNVFKVPAFQLSLGYRFKGLEE